MIFPQFFHLTSLVPFILFFISIYGQANQQYLECLNGEYTCGQQVMGITYPFWGNGRPSYCGPEEFQLTCHDNEYTTINIKEQIFRVLHIDQRNRSMTIVLDVLWDNLCPQVFTTISLNHTLYSYGPTAYENLTLFYNCSEDITVSPRRTFNCEINELNRRVFFEDSRYPSAVSQYSERCSNMTVPVLREAIEELKNNVTMELREVINLGFEVVYHIDNISCSACQLSGGLCWTNTTSLRCLCRNGIHPVACPNSGSHPNLRRTIIGGVVAAAASVVLFILICCLGKFIRQHGYSTPQILILIETLKVYNSTRSRPFWKRETDIDRNVEEFIRQHGYSTPQRYKYSQIKKITNSFKDQLGSGGFGTVYRGKLVDGRLVAVKILNASKGNGDDFINEVASIGRTSHTNVVSLFGFCYEGKKRALIYEYMSNGSLDKFLNDGELLSGEKLYTIALGIARGLEYLHSGCNTRILHFDIKPHNILLDKDFCPKISDFGMAKTYHGKDSSIVSMAEARGTIGYIAPEVFCRSVGVVSHKSDVYSYGMLLLEMVGGKSNCYAGVSNKSSEIYFPHWIYKRLDLNEDLRLRQVIQAEESEITRRIIIVGLWCIQTDPVLRPSMNKVIEMLVGSLEALQIPPRPFLSSPPPEPLPLHFSTSGASSN